MKRIKCAVCKEYFWVSQIDNNFFLSYVNSKNQISHLCSQCRLYARYEIKKIDKKPLFQQLLNLSIAILGVEAFTYVFYQYSPLFFISTAFILSLILFSMYIDMDDKTE